MATARFKREWEADAACAFTTFLVNLCWDGINTKAELEGLGITASRNTTTLLLLAQNSDVLTKAQEDATHSGGALSRMFERQTDTVQARLTLAQNNVGALFADIGQSTSGPVRLALDLFNSLLTVVD